MALERFGYQVLTDCTTQHKREKGLKAQLQKYLLMRHNRVQEGLVLQFRGPKEIIWRKRNFRQWNPGSF